MLDAQPLARLNFGAMDVRRKLERLAAKKRQEVVEMERRLVEARGVVQGIEESIRALPRVAGDTATLLRPGSKIARTRDAILQAGHSLHIDEILKALDSPVNQQTRMALGGSLSTYVRKGEVFTRTAPNTFGLLALTQSANNKEKESELDEEEIEFDDEKEVPF